MVLWRLYYGMNLSKMTHFHRLNLSETILTLSYGDTFRRVGARVRGASEGVSHWVERRGVLRRGAERSGASGASE